MSKAAKQSILILFLLLCAATVFSAITVSQKQAIEGEKVSLETKIKEFAEREKKHIQENVTLKKKVEEVQAAKAKIEKKLEDLDEDIPGLKQRLKKLTKERDQWQEKLDALTEERDELADQLEEKPTEKIVYKYVEKETEETEEKAEDKEEETAKKLAMPPEDDESYWAQVIREKISLQLEMEKVKEKLTSSAVDIVELKKKNSDLQLELNKIKNDKEAIEREIKHGKDLADNLALELARAQNDKKFLSDRIAKLDDENTNLLAQIRQLTSTKIALEKSIVRLQEDRKEIEKKLLHTENVIQSRIDEIWKIKESLETEFNPVKVEETGEIELPPIVVSAQGPTAAVANPSVDTTVGQTPGFQGNIVSVNEENNFVIVDIGEVDGLDLGDNLSVYRDANYVAGLEVIQLRDDIAAADIKNKVAKIEVGDSVR